MREKGEGNRSVGEQCALPWPQKHLRQHHRGDSSSQRSAGGSCCARQERKCLGPLK